MKFKHNLTLQRHVELKGINFKQLILCCMLLKLYNFKHLNAKYRCAVKKETG